MATKYKIQKTDIGYPLPWIIKIKKTCKKKWENYTSEKDVYKAFEIILTMMNDAEKCDFTLLVTTKK